MLKFENTLKITGTFRKWPFKAVIWQAQNQFVEAWLYVKYGLRMFWFNLSQLLSPDKGLVEMKCKQTFDPEKKGMRTRFDFFLTFLKTS